MTLNAGSIAAAAAAIAGELVPGINRRPRPLPTSAPVNMLSLLLFRHDMTYVKCGVSVIKASAASAAAPSTQSKLALRIRQKSIIFYPPWSVSVSSEKSMQTQLKNTVLTVAEPHNTRCIFTFSFNHKTSRHTSRHCITDPADNKRMLAAKQIDTTGTCRRCPINGLTDDRLLFIARMLSSTQISHHHHFHHHQQQHPYSPGHGA